MLRVVGRGVGALAHARARHAFPCLAFPLLLHYTRSLPRPPEGAHTVVGIGAVMPGSYAGHRTDGLRKTGQAADLTAVSFAHTAARQCRTSGQRNDRCSADHALA